MPYRLRRNTRSDTQVLIKSGSIAECQATLDSIKRKWLDVKDVTFTGEAFTVKSEKGKLTITQSQRVVDEYVIEETK
jgi:hypothetical protein